MANKRTKLDPIFKTCQLETFISAPVPRRTLLSSKSGARLPATWWRVGTLQSFWQCSGGQVGRGKEGDNARLDKTNRTKLPADLAARPDRRRDCDAMRFLLPSLIHKIADDDGDMITPGIRSGYPESARRGSLAYYPPICLLGDPLLTSTVT